MPGLPMRQQPGAGARELNTKFKVVKLVGKGSYGSVYQVQRLSDGKTYALKEMDVRSMNQAEKEDSVNEVRLLASISHPNVISYNEAFLDGNRLCIIMEFAPDGDLAKVIKKYSTSKARMPEDKIWVYFIQVARGLAQLHSMKVLHRDIKPGNIMVMNNGVCKIGDLGIAKILRHTMAKTQIGTPHYMPPEIWRNKSYGFQSDSWAMGCILYEMATNNVPFEARSMNELKSKVLRGHYPAIPSSYSKDLSDLVARCLDQNPDKRPTMNDILSSGAVQSRVHLLQGLDMPPVLQRAPSSNQLLDTIKVPRNFQGIKGKLPPPSYASDITRMQAVGEEEEMASQANARLLQLPGVQQQRQQQMAQMHQQMQQAMQGKPMVPTPLQPNNRQPPQKLSMIYPPQNVMVPTPPNGAYRNAGSPPPSVYEALRQAQVQAMNGNKMYKPKGNTGVSESHAAYGAFYYSPKEAPPMYRKNGQPPPWADKRPPPAQQMMVQQQQQQQQQMHLHQQQQYQQQKAYQGYYDPYSKGGPGGGQQQQRQPPAKLPSIAQRQQQAAMERLAKPQAPAWNFGAGGQFPKPRSNASAAPGSQWAGPKW